VDFFVFPTDPVSNGLAEQCAIFKAIHSQKLRLLESGILNIKLSTGLAVIQYFAT
jgi:hypothetical protein